MSSWWGQFSNLSTYYLSTYLSIIYLYLNINIFRHYREGDDCETCKKFMKAFGKLLVSDDAADEAITLLQGMINYL